MRVLILSGHLINAGQVVSAVFFQQTRSRSRGKHRCRQE